MAKDTQRIYEFRGRASYIAGVLTLFERAGFSVEYVYDSEADKRSWGARIQPTDELSQEMGSRSQILLWVDYFDVFEARSLERIQQKIEEARPRLREDIAFFVSNDPQVSSAVSALPSDMTVISLAIDKLREFNQPGGPDFKRHVLTRVFSRDPYQLTGAVINSWQFFGRARLIAELVASVNSGHKIGLFGLRKIGKTSVLLRLVDQLHRSNANMTIAHLQVARVDAVRRSSEYFLWSLGQSLFLALPADLRFAEFRLLGRYGVFADVPPNAELPDLFLHDINALLHRQTVTLCFIFDEIERMWPSRREVSTSAWLSEFPRVWQLLRSIDQEFPGRLSMVMAGTNPECIEQAMIGERDNPLFQYVQIRYLSFLEKPDADNLLKDLGARAGLMWNSDACRLAYEQVAGHPALLRIVGSAVYSQGRDHERRRLISESIVADATVATTRTSSPILNEVCGALREGYPDDYMLLELLGQNRLGEFQQYSAVFPDAVQHLQGYGLIADAATSPRISFSLLQSHVQGMLRASQKVAPSVGLPERIGHYIVQSSLGRAGGFGTVYKVCDGENVFALKLFHVSSLTALNREVDILREMHHERIVQFVDSGHDPTAGNYIVMELLEGRSWLNLCTRAMRLRPKDAKSKIIQVLSALAYIHPKPTHGSPALTDISLQEILGRSIGYIHRDIKPENVIEVPRRGPVLIDFGIASKAGDPTRTTSATPGYLPPDFVQGRWDADTDLYQAGLTFLQVLVGEVYTGSPSQLDDYRKVLEADPELPRQVKKLVLRLCDPDRARRYRRATDAIDQLR